MVPDALDLLLAALATTRSVSDNTATLPLLTKVAMPQPTKA